MWISFPILTSDITTVFANIIGSRIESRGHHDIGALVVCTAANWSAAKRSASTIGMWTTRLISDPDPAHLGPDQITGLAACGSWIAGARNVFDNLSPVQSEPNGHRSQ